MADDYYQIAKESTYNYSKDETGKDNVAHKDVIKWHYFINDIYFAEFGSEEYTPYRVSINVKEKADGDFVYSFSPEKQKSDTPQTLHAAVNEGDNSNANVRLSNNNVPQKSNVVKNNISKNPSNDTDTAEFLYVGENAKTTNKLELSNAKQMLKDGADSETIRKETGWFKGYDGKWRFEINDKDVEIDDDLALNNLFEAMKFNRLRREYLDKKVSNADFVKAAAEYLNSDISNICLKDLFIHNKLYEAYPQLGGLSIIIRTLPEKGMAAFDENTASIHLDWGIIDKPDITTSLKKLLIHEIQHAIQYIEGFTKGSSGVYWQARKDNGEVFLDENGNEISNGDLYFRTAGEIEAYDASGRYLLDDDERKNTRPDIDRKDVVFADKELTSVFENAQYSIPSDHNYVYTNGKASFTEERLNNLFDEHSLGDGKRAEHSNAYVGYISPEDFVNLTSNKNIRSRVEDEAYVLNEEELRNETETPFIEYDPATGEVVNHEGRHRMVALKADGITKVAVLLKPSTDSFERRTVQDISLTGQNFAEGRAVGKVTVKTAVPLSEKYREKAIQKFAQNPDADVRYSLPDVDRYADYDKPITLKGIEVLRSIGRKSVNKFKPADLEKAQKWAYKFYQQLGEKSPFFRAWFGDWRAYDIKNKIPVINKSTAKTFKAGKAENADTGRYISWGDQIKGETKIKYGTESDVYGFLENIEEIVKNSILLDTNVSVLSSKHKMDNTEFMHSMYSIIEDKDGNECLIKLLVEEAFNDKMTAEFSRAYELQEIKKVATLHTGVHSNNGGLTRQVTTNYSISELFEFVKQYDKSFSPKPVDKHLVNEDGTPKKFYHGTREKFTEFSKKKAKPGFYGRGFYFTTEKSQSNVYGESMEVYLNIKNPLVPGETKITKSQIIKFLEAVADNEDYSIENYGTYDVNEIANRITNRDAFAVIQDINSTAIGDFGEAMQLFNEVNNTNFDGVITPTETIVYDNTKIKSAEKGTPNANIGTFDKTEGDIRYSIPDIARGKTAPELWEMSQKGEITSDDALKVLADEYGTMPKGESPKVDVTLPEQISKSKNVNQFMRNVLESGHLDADMSETEKRNIISGARTYKPISDKAALSRAESKIKTDVNGAVQEWKDLL